MPFQLRGPLSIIQAKTSYFNYPLFTVTKQVMLILGHFHTGIILGTRFDWAVAWQEMSHLYLLWFAFTPHFIQSDHVTASACLGVWVGIP